MSNSHPLHPFFTTFEPIAHPLLAAVAATVPFFFPTVSETVPSDWRIYLLRSPEQPPATCNSSSNLLLPDANTAIARGTGQYGRQRRFPAGGGAVWKRRRERIYGGGRTARRGSQVPVRFLFVDGIEIQPRVRQQAVTFVNTCARRTGRSYAKRRDEETLTQLSRHGDNSPVRQEVLQRSRAATRSINILALVSYIRVLISRTCNHLSFPKGTPRSHRSLPWALHLPRAAHAAAKLPTLF